LKLLAFDTSTEMCSVAVYHDGSWLTDDTRAGNRHSELLLPTIGGLLAAAGFGLKQLDGIAYGMGPGSFTGLRIACGVAQGLALGAELPVAGVVTLDAMAWASGSERVVACLDARMHEVYCAAYRRVDSGLHREIAPCVCRPEAVPLPAGTGWVACGNAFGVHAQVLTGRLGDRLAGIEPDVWPTAMAVCELALPRFMTGEATPPDRAEPYYVRDKVALKTSERLPVVP
jgi:tRNA threonylcarbamoyladenosine biosynthesis protein TsaB